MNHTLHARFDALHRGDTPLMIANAWDAASTALWQHAGAPAIGTSSAALAWACGYADGGPLDRDALLGKVREICRVAKVPVSIDLEDGYSADPAQVAALVRVVAQAGAVGINLEDGSEDPELLVPPYGRNKAMNCFQLIDDLNGRPQLRTRLVGQRCRKQRVRN